MPTHDNIYKEHGYENREDYLRSLSDDHGVDFNTVLAMSEVLGENEDFDGLVTELEDNAEMFNEF